MSVPTWLREESTTEYLYRIYKLNIRIGEIIHNHPKKYRTTYGDKVINLALEALSNANSANDIKFSTNLQEKDFLKRRNFLKQANQNIRNLSEVFYIFLELTSKTDGVKIEKIIKQEKEIGTMCQEISKRLKTILEEDKYTYYKFKK